MEEKHAQIAPRLSQADLRGVLSVLKEDCQTAIGMLDASQTQLLDPSESLYSQEAMVRHELLEVLRAGIGQSDDVVFHPIPLATASVYLVYVSNMASEQMISSAIIHPLSQNIEQANTVFFQGRPEVIQKFVKQHILNAQLSLESSVTGIIEGILKGNTAIIIPGQIFAPLVATASPSARSVGKTTVENVLRGPMDAFTESLDSNISLVRRRINDATFRVHDMTVGNRTRTRVSLCYLAERVSNDALAQLTSAIDLVDVDAITDSGQLAQLIRPDWFHFFPLAIATERPDRVAMSIFDGRIALVVDNSPFVLILPSLYVDFFQAMEDRYSPWVASSLMRVLRLISDHISVLLPALYVCFASFNPGMASPQFVLVLASSRAMVPYSPLVEAILVLLLTDILIEASIRSPKVVGSAIPIVGGIVIGAVLTKTHLASEVMLVAGALSSITQFTAAEPSIATIQRANKYWFVLWAGGLGFLGLMIATGIELAYMGALESLGMPYFYPVAPFAWREALNAKFALPPRLRPRSNVK